VSTKNLARTVIEGGRTGGYKSEVREAQHSERASSRTFLRAVQKDVDAADALPTPKRVHVGKEFADKLNPVYQFLDSRIGKNWSKVRAEMFERFDSRTTPGRHILFDHALSTVDESGNTDRFRYIRYVVDKQGRLQKNKERTRYAKWRPLEPVDWDAIIAWLGNRKVISCGERFAWMIPTRDTNVRASFGKLNSWPYNTGRLQYVFVDRKGQLVVEEVPCPYPPQDIRAKLWTRRTVEKVSTTTRWRQAQLLDKADEAFFLGLPKHARDAVLESSQSGTRSNRVFR